jgi:predicted transcriptional regulator of viral defense system
MKMNVLLKKLRMGNVEFVTSSELKAYCRSMRLNYGTVVRYFSARGYLIRVFRGIFYVKSVEEYELGRSRYGILELVAKGLELKEVKSWYFGLRTALKLNNMTHEHFAVEDVVSDKIFRANPITIAGYKFKFIKLSPTLLGFGIRKEKGINYSDPEKTILDFIYIWRYNGVPEEKIVADVSEWATHATRKRLRSYAENYPRSVKEIVERVVR